MVTFILTLSGTRANIRGTKRDNLDFQPAVMCRPRNILGLMFPISESEAVNHYVHQEERIHAQIQFTIQAYALNPERLPMARYYILPDNTSMIIVKLFHA